MWVNRGNLVKLSHGHFRIVHDQSSPKGGRPPGCRESVEKNQRKASLKYCDYCGRQLNRNNKSGICRTCAPNGKLKIT